MPKVSIIVPNYNYAHFLGRRLASIKDQTFRDFDVTLLDDASVDGSVQVFEQFARGQRHWRAVCNEANSGSVFRQWNKGLRLATGEYVWIAESDDYADERLLETLVGRLDENPRCGIACCRSFRVDVTDRVLGTTLPTLFDVDLDRWRHDFISNGQVECARYLLRDNTIPNASAVLFRRDLCETVGGVDETFRLNGDWKFYASLLKISDVAYVAQPLNYFRTAHAKTTRATTPLWRRAAETFRVMEYILSTIDVPQDALEDLHARIAILVLHGLLSQGATLRDLRDVRQWAARLRFRFSARTTAGIGRQLVQATKRRLSHGTDADS